MTSKYRFDHAHRTPIGETTAFRHLRVGQQSMLPRAQDVGPAVIAYVAGPPVQLFLSDGAQWRELGFSQLARATASLTLGDTNADVPGAQVTLPVAGQAYLLIAVFDIEFTIVGATVTAAAGIGVLTNAAGTEQGPPAWAVYKVREPGETQRATVTQLHRVVTQGDNEVYKLRARKLVLPSGATAEVVVNVNHTSLAASGFLGGGVSQAAGSHGQEAHTGKIGESEFQILIPIKKPIPGANVQNAQAASVQLGFACALKRLRAWLNLGEAAAAGQTDFVVKRDRAGVVTTFGTVTIASGARQGTSDPTDLACLAGDELFVDMGGQSGAENKTALVAVIAERDLEAQIP
ncbi:MAG: hypothetical protein QW838_04195 [Candidatus Nitrosotenuis sp.]